MEQHPAGGQLYLVFTEHQDPKANQFNPKNKGISIIHPIFFSSFSANCGLNRHPTVAWDSKLYNGSAIF